MSKALRIGTRDSELATWQARQVQRGLQQEGHKAELVFIKSEGDLDQDTPLPEMGGRGVFTKTLDKALLGGQIDLAVHSYKDLPTKNPLPLKIAAVMEREDPRDALVAPRGVDFMEQDDFKAVIATGSNRRRAQWLARFPKHEMTNLRGNVNTRLRKVREKGWQGAIFAAAGLKRIGLDDNISAYLDWMLPAAAQGAMAVMIREDDGELFKKLQPLNHEATAQCTAAEREVLHEMEAGCTAPVGAYARIDGDKIRLSAVAVELDGSEKFEFEDTAPADDAEALGRRAAHVLLNAGADRILASHKRDR